MGIVKRVVMAFASPERRAAIEAESRAWQVKCRDCGDVRSVWDLGGVRYKASGNPSWRFTCRACGAKTWHDVYKRDED